MFSTWITVWDDIIATANHLVPLCMERLKILPDNQHAISAEVLERVQVQLATDTESIRKAPHIWGTQLANVCVRISRNISDHDVQERAIARELANFSALVFNFRRSRDPNKYETPFRNSLENYFAATLPEYTSSHIAPDVADAVHDWLSRYYQDIPDDLLFRFNDLILEAYERRRRELDLPESRGLMMRFLEDNRSLINLRVSDRLEWQRKQWEALYREHIGEPPPPSDGSILNRIFRDRLLEAVRTNDPLAVRDVIAPERSALEHAVASMLHVRFDYHEPKRPILDGSGEHPEFQGAKRQARIGNPAAVRSFRSIWQAQRTNYFAQEWFAYAQLRFDQNIRSAKRYLEEIREVQRGSEVTDWNLACCEIVLGDRQTAYEILRTRVEQGNSMDLVLEPALSLALELRDDDFLAKYLEWLPQEEAILLRYLIAADAGATREDLDDWLSAVEVIASASYPFDVPDPAESLSAKRLNDLCFEFIERQIRRAGIRWFRQRVSFRTHQYFHLNWQLLADLCFQAGDLNSAVDASRKRLQCTVSSKATHAVKAEALEDVINTLITYELTDAARAILADFGSRMLSAPEFQRWNDRLGDGPRASEQRRVVADRDSDMRHGQENGSRIVVSPGPRVENNTPKPPSEDPHVAFLRSLQRLARIRSVSDLPKHEDLTASLPELLFGQWPAYARKLADALRATLESLQAFARTTDIQKKTEVATNVQQTLTVLRANTAEISQPGLKEQADEIFSIIQKFARDASFQTDVPRTIEIDTRLCKFLPDVTQSPIRQGEPRTSLALRLRNTENDPVTDIRVHLESETGGVTIQEPIQHIAVIESLLTFVVNFPLDYERLEKDEVFSAYAEFSVGSITGLRTAPIRFEIPTAVFNERAGVSELTDSFFVGVGIPGDRRDVFHGREREQQRIARGLRGTVQSEVLFLNGPRRVGKTSILNSLSWALPEMGLNNIIPVLLPEAIPETTAAFLKQTAEEIARAVDLHLGVSGYLNIPNSSEFENSPIATFRTFCEAVHHQLAPREILIMIDETQRLAAAVREGRVDDNVLALFSTLMSRSSGIMFLFTASVLFRDVKELSDNPIWGRLTQFAAGFLNPQAVADVLRAGMGEQPVQLTPEAIDRVWEYTEGHPWVLQAIGKRVVSEILNPQRRLLVTPSDIDRVVRIIQEEEDQYSEFWWNEKTSGKEGGFIEALDWNIAKVILNEQASPRRGVPRDLLFKRMSESGQPINNERLQRLIDMQVLAKTSDGHQEGIRIKALFLELWLTKHDLVSKLSNSRFQTKVALSPTVALFVDHENVFVSMKNYVEQLPQAKQESWRAVREARVLARRLVLNAERFGKIVPPRYAVANWPQFVGDLPGYAEAMFDFQQPLGGKNTSDEKLKQLIRDVLEQRPDVETYIIATGDADFRDTVQTLLKRNKHVVLWGFRSVGTLRSNVSGEFKQMEKWQNLTIEYLDDLLPHPDVSSDLSLGAVS